MGEVVECPKHNGRFNYKTGKALRRPAITNLPTYPVKVEAGTVYIEI
jgi:3-phenylpropionate/trans-cinnamate dioxygenase ferredoxin subunit